LDCDLYLTHNTITHDDLNSNTNESLKAKDVNSFWASISPIDYNEAESNKTELQASNQSVVYNCIPATETPHASGHGKQAEESKGTMMGEMRGDLLPKNLSKSGTEEKSIEYIKTSVEECSQQEISKVTPVNAAQPPPTEAVDESYVIDQSNNNLNQNGRSRNDTCKQLHSAENIQNFARHLLTNYGNAVYLDRETVERVEVTVEPEPRYNRLITTAEADIIASVMDNTDGKPYQFAKLLNLSQIDINGIVPIRRQIGHFKEYTSKNFKGGRGGVRVSVDESGLNHINDIKCYAQLAARSSKHLLTMRNVIIHWLEKQTSEDSSRDLFRALIKMNEVEVARKLRDMLEKRITSSAT
ncbi:unnamed protein product, partial [Didymodactylos carnosus]